MSLLNEENFFISFDRAVQGICRYFSIINKTIFLRFQNTQHSIAHTGSEKLTCQNFFFSLRISLVLCRYTHTHKIKAEETCFSDYIIPRKSEGSERGKWEDSREEVNSKQNSSRNFLLC